MKSFPTEKYKMFNISLAFSGKGIPRVLYPKFSGLCLDGSLASDCQIKNLSEMIMRWAGHVARMQEGRSFFSKF